MKTTTIGIDLAKSVFQVHGVDAEGEVTIRKKLRRAEVLKFFEALAPCLVGMEACATAHHWAREIGALGHDVRLMPPSYVKAYVRRQKNDAADAEAICEAVTRPTMRFVPVKSAERQGVLVLHRSASCWYASEPWLINAITRSLRRVGDDRAAGRTTRASDLVEQVRKAEHRLPTLARSALLMLAEQLDAWLCRSMSSNARRWSGIARTKPASAWRLSPAAFGTFITATALAASCDGPRAVFAPGRGFAAFLGLVPRQQLLRRQGSSRAHIQDGRRLSEEAPRGRRDLSHPSRGSQHIGDRRLGRSLLERKPARVVTVAMANKTAPSLGRARSWRVYRVPSDGLIETAAANAAASNVRVQMG